MMSRTDYKSKKYVPSRRAQNFTSILNLNHNLLPSRQQNDGIIYIYHDNLNRNRLARHGALRNNTTLTIQNTGGRDKQGM